MTSEIRNPELWKDGELKIEWVRRHMPLLAGLEKEFKETKPFKGKKIALSVHLEAKTAHLCEILAVRCSPQAEPRCTSPAAIPSPHRTTSQQHSCTRV